MAPSCPERSRSTSARSHHGPDTDERQAQQAGRSSTHLAAQHSVQSLREASRAALHAPQNPWRSTPDFHVEEKRSRHSLSHARSPLSASHSAESWPIVSPHTPGEPQSLLRSPPSSGSGVLSSGSSVDAAEALPGQASRGEYHSNRHLTVPPRSDVARRPSLPAIATTSHRPRPVSGVSTPTGGSHSLSSPRSVRDLGTDYTRYFSPFHSPSVSPPHSSRRSSACLLHGSSRSGGLPADGARRISDPFGDNRRVSNLSFASSQEHVLPPCGPDRCPIHEVHPAVVTIADPPPQRPADPEKQAFFQYLDDRLGAPGYAFPLITDAKEDDDDMHMPQWDDDIRLKPTWRDHFTRENIVSTFGLFFMLCGLLCIFVVLPVLSWTGIAFIDPPGEVNPPKPGPPPWNYINNETHPLLRNVRHGLIDPDTPQDAMTRKSIHGEELVLVFSDEFNDNNRTFYSGDDPYWFGFDGWYGATLDLEWYDPDAITTYGGALNLQLDQFENHNLSFRSGMLNSWNQLCFKGGVFEVSMSLPGPAGVHGLWPGVWTMGNLGRPGYLATTEGLWPYTYSECDAGITPNQSSPDGLSWLPGQRLASCTCPGEDHPSPGRGRGAPEIDIAEVSASWGAEQIGVATQSFQVAPMDIWYYPNYDFMQNPNPSLSLVNTWTGGPIQEAVSTTSMLNNEWYDGNAYQKFAFEYAPGSNESAFVAWTIGDEEMMQFDARAIGPNGIVGQRLVTEEPMSMILNLGISENWVAIDFGALTFPTTLRVDYVRWYQRPGHEMVTCDPPGYETTDYIRQHPVAYNNPNVTKWEEAGYEWPKNEFMHGCG